MHPDRSERGEGSSSRGRGDCLGDPSPRASREPRVGRALCCVTARPGGWDVAEAPPRLGRGRVCVCRGGCAT